jgi:hypothetical protein
MADFRVTKQDRYEFNAWIKGRLKDEPRLLQFFDSEDSYEDFMINYENSHIDLENDPAVIDRQFSENDGNSVECSWSDNVYKGQYYDHYFIREDGEKLRFNNSSYGDDEFNAIVTVVDGIAYLTKEDTSNFSDRSNLYRVVYEIINEHNQGENNYLYYLAENENDAKNKFEQDFNSGKSDNEKLNIVYVELVKEGMSKLFSRGFSAGPREKVSAEMLKKAKTDGVVQKKPNGAWGIISIKAGEWWTPDYDTKDKAEKALQAYHANKGFSDNSMQEVRFLTTNPEQLTEIVKAIGEHGNGGHSFEIAVDYKDENQEVFGWDGDGSDRIDLDSVKTFNKVSSDLPIGIDSKLQAIAQEFRTINYQDIIKFKYTTEAGRRINSLYRSITNAMNNGDDDKANHYAELVANVVKGDKTFSFAEEGVASVFEIIGMLLHSIADFHLFHLLTTDYAAHMALEDYYEGMPELVDAFAEDTLSTFDKADEIKPEWYTGLQLGQPETIPYLHCMLGIIGDYREANKNTLRDSQKSELDAIEQLMSSTLYKLKRLSSSESRKFTFA